MFFLRMILVLLAIVGLPAWGIFYIFFRKKKFWRFKFPLLIILLAVGAVCYVSFGIVTGRPQWLWQLFLPLFLGISFVEIFICLGKGLAWLLRKAPFLSRTALCMGFTLAFLSITFATMAYFQGNKRIEVKEFTFSSADLPREFDGLRIVHISDLHLGTYGSDTGRVGELINKVMEQKGDVVLFTGDLVNFSAREAEPFVEQLARVKAPLGVYSILGNHDYALYSRNMTKREQAKDIRKLLALQKKCGWQVLRNENVLIKRNGQSIAIIGVENDGRSPFPQLANIPKALKGLPKQQPLFKIFLTHDPSHWRRNVLSETDAQLTLAGHTHGMQFMIGDWSPASLIYKEWGGQYYENSRSLIVSLGLGLGSVPFRFGAWSEVGVITLRAE